MLAQRAVSLPQWTVRGKLVWVWWASGSMQPQGTRIILTQSRRVCFVFNAASGSGQYSQVQCFPSALLCSECAHTRDTYTVCQLPLASVVPPQGLLAYAVILICSRALKRS
eukprot:121716-Pelagomonas_calceolata.AAC.1